MAKLSIINKTLMFLALFGILFIIIGFISKGSIKGISNELSEEKNYTYNKIDLLEEIEEINIKLLSRNLEIYSTLEESYLEYYINLDKEELINDLTDKTLNFEISYKTRRMSIFQIEFFSSKANKVSIYLNEKDLNKIDIKLISGNLILDYEKELNELNINSTSGNIRLNNVNVKTNAKLKLTSGNLFINSLKAKDIEIANTSGNVTLKNIISETLNIKQTSGGVNLEKIEVFETKIVVTSGNVIISEKKEDVSFKLNVKSGVIRVYGNKKGDSYSNEYKTYNYEVKSTSGNITIK